MATGYKSGGRKKGTPNKLTKDIRSVLKDVIFNEINNIEDNLSKLEPKERLELMIKLIPYALPKVESEKYSLGEPLDWGIE